MDSRNDNRKTTNGQLRPMLKRMTLPQQIRRAMKETRRATSLHQGQAMAMGRANIAMAFIARGFVGRFKWLLLGR